MATTWSLIFSFGVPGLRFAEPHAGMATVPSTLNPSGATGCQKLTQCLPPESSSSQHHVNLSVYAE